MKASRAAVISGIATVVILGIGAGGGGYESKKLAAAERRRAVLVREAEKLGMSQEVLGEAPRGQPARQGNKRPLDKRADQLFELMKGLGDGSGKEGEAKLMELFERLPMADGAVLREFLTRVFNEPGLEGEACRIVVAQALMLHAEQSPDGSLDLLGKAAAIFSKEAGFQALGEQVVAIALAEWAVRDPLAAAGWLRDHGDTHGKFLTENARQAVLAAAATRDPRLAFGMLEEIGIGDRGTMVNRIMKSVADPGDRLAALSALREYLAGAADGRREIRKSGLQGLASGISAAGFECGRVFLEKARLDPEERDLFAAGLQPREGENGKWLCWMGENVSAEVLEKDVAKRVSLWAEGDYQAAGHWLAELPGGNLREISVAAYAETAARYDPETAARWAMTLPPGERREEAGRKVFESWPREDPADARAADEFARRQGLE